MSRRADNRRHVIWLVVPCTALLACGNDSGGGSAASGGATMMTSGGAPSAMAGTSSGGTSSFGGFSAISGSSSGGAVPSSGGASPSTSGGAGSGGAPVASGGTPNSAGGPSGNGGREGPGGSEGGRNDGGRSGGGRANAGGNQSGAGAPAQGGASGAEGGAGGAVTASCPSPALKAGDMNQTVTVGSTSRSYILHVPAKYDGTKPVPLVVDFHPLGGSGMSERSGSPYPAQTDAEGVIMAFPNGQSGPSGGAWNVGPCCVKNVDDVAFAKALVAQVEKSACIDPKRVYAVGFSMGGGMSHYLACHAADVFAAVSPAAFDLLEENVDDCMPPRPITVVSFRSTGDPIVPYAGGYSSVVQGMPITFLGAKGTFAKWAQINQCSGAASAEDSNGCASYSGCQDGVDVVLCTKQGGTHEPGNASVAWPILKKHVLP